MPPGCAAWSTIFCPNRVFEDAKPGYRLALSAFRVECESSGDGPWPKVYGAETKGRDMLVHSDPVDPPNDIYAGTPQDTRPRRCQQSYLLRMAYSLWLKGFSKQISGKVAVILNPVNSWRDGT